MTETLSPRDRLLETASRLFYSEGIHTVGVDKLVTAAGVTRATFYRHFPTKEDLVVAYLRSQHDQIRAGVESAARTEPDGDAALAVLDFVGDSTCGAGFRGCPFINAAAEYSDPENPVRVMVSEHRAWFHDALLDLVTKAGHPDPTYAAAALVLLRDGALQGGELDDPEQVKATLRRACRQVLAA
ncbi:DNA-binding transcriptional regulator, AcrR family [Amycolatopsis xylanica]|uniref:DNA-binding transcriptional regulator, AcrR family n=1 Tax=Amycolatopsis xylanica TaxID=589385 RepID=A0A1H3HFJ9_9PSEU|nr:TetR/AcrR family transcriptional regulator [Amycolatopsis xylanica]SDY13439.1 DNA-binding transcriptional regulator, AcrR family [Amycolatopsis xylanica]